MKVCFTSSSGGHFEQLLMLKKLFDYYDSFIVTEKTKYNQKYALTTYFLKQVNRSNIFFIFPLLYNVFFSIYILFKERPKIVISTGVLSTIPLCIFAKLLGKKLIYIESFAKINSATLTGKVMYKFADVFYVQWQEMLKVYPKAKFIGGIY